MVDIKQVTKELTGVVGLYSGMNAGGDIVAADHNGPTLYLSDAHALLRPEILKALGPNLDVLRPEAYDESKPYALYDLVANVDGTLYECQKAGANNTLLLAENWKETTGLSAWFGRIERGAIAKLMLLATTSPASVPLVDNQQLFALEGNRSETINKQGRFVGWQIFVSGNDSALQIVKSGLQLLGTVFDFPVYIFHSTQDEPVATIRYSATSTGRSLWADINRYLYQRVGGYYLVGYYEDDLPDGVYAIGAQRSFTVAGCGSCGGGIDKATYEARAPFVHIQPCYVPGPLTPGLMTWDNLAEKQIASQSWGLNMVISVQCDATRAMLNNKSQFTQALLYMVACDVLQAMSANDRVNNIAKNMTSQAFIALNGQKDTNDKGLVATRDKAIADLKDALSKISSCTPEPPKRGIGISSMWG